MKLKELKTTWFKTNKKYNFIFPIGATEQHGNFLPLGTDTYFTDYLVQQITQKIPEIIVLPTLEFSRSQEHRNFFGTIWLTKETLQSVMFDVCNSLQSQAKKIFIISFHANEIYVKEFIEKNSFGDTKIILLEIFNDEDDKQIEKIISGVIDGHAGNTEISNMLFLDASLVKIPDKNDHKYQVKNPFETDNLQEKCPNGIADNHPQWVISKKIGAEIFEIYINRLIHNLKNNLI